MTKMFPPLTLGSGLLLSDNAKSMEALLGALSKETGKSALGEDTKPLGLESMRNSPPGLSVGVAPGCRCWMWPSLELGNKLLSSRRLLSLSCWSLPSTDFPPCTVWFRICSRSLLLANPSSTSATKT